MATRRIQLEEFLSRCSDFTLCVVQNRSLCRLLRFWQEIMATLSHWHQNLESQEAPRHVQCAARLRPYITAVIFHIKGHDQHLLSDSLVECWRPVVRMSTSSPAWDLTQLCLVFMLVLLPVHLLHLLNYAKVPKRISGRMSKWSKLITYPNTRRFSDPFILHPESSRSVVSSRITTAEGPS